VLSATKFKCLQLKSILLIEKEGKLNEFDTDARAQNMKSCVDYVFEYFNNLNITEAEEKTVFISIYFITF
jgi:hypothetical protein